MDIRAHTLRLLESLVHKRDIGLHHVNLPPQFGAFSGLVYCRILSNLHINTSAIIIWEFDPLVAAMEALRTEMLRPRNNLGLAMRLP